jgi:hypothetical protein
VWRFRNLFGYRFSFWKRLVADKGNALLAYKFSQELLKLSMAISAETVAVLDPVVDAQDVDVHNGLHWLDRFSVFGPRLLRLMK